jgi:hypothetical protein
LPPAYTWLQPWFLSGAVVSFASSILCFSWPIWRQLFNRRGTTVADALSTIFDKVRQLADSSFSTPAEYDAWVADVEALPSWIQNQLAGKLSPAEINILLNGPSGPRLIFRGHSAPEYNTLQNYLHCLEKRVSQSIQKYS